MEEDLQRRLFRRDIHLMLPRQPPHKFGCDLYPFTSCTTARVLLCFSYVDTELL